MRREDIAISVLWILALLVTGWAAYKTLKLVKDLGPAIIAAATTVIAAILTHVFTEIRQQRIEQHKQKLKNYEKLLDMVALYIRSPHEIDKLEKVHLYSWVVGSKEVIEHTQEFTKKRDDQTLRMLLVSMRKDIGLTKISNDIKPEVFKTTLYDTLRSCKN